MASFQSAAELPDRDEEDPRPEVTCADCGAFLGTHPVGVYADCEECGGCTLSRWMPEPEGPGEADIAARTAAWAEAMRRQDRLHDLDVAVADAKRLLAAHDLTLDERGEDDRITSSSIHSARRVLAFSGELHAVEEARQVAERERQAERLRAEAADGRLAALARMVREEREAQEALESASLDAWAATARTLDAARLATDALLHGAATGYVPARLVQKYLDAASASAIAREAVDRIEEGGVAFDNEKDSEEFATAMRRAGETGDALHVALAALDAALAAATTTPPPKESP